MILTSHQSDKGFTLLEVIVVLTITSLITAILMQGLGIVLNTRLRVADELVRIETVSLQNSVIKSPLVGVLPGLDESENSFSGQERRIKGLTLTPLRGTMGAPTSFEMALQYVSRDNVTELVYLEEGYNPVRLAKWEGDTGEFSYRGRSGDWRTSWPPRPGVLNPDEKFKQTPSSIKIESGLPLFSSVIRVMGPHNRLSPVRTGPFGTISR